MQTGLTRCDPVGETPKDLIGSQILKVRLNPDELAALNKVAEHRGLPAASVVRQQILRLLAEDIGYSPVKPIHTIWMAAARLATPRWASGTASVSPHICVTSHRSAVGLSQTGAV
ncbi:hypothetical protein A5739_00485 [Mycobacterium colombiense]|uniref:ribbon-helix-helix domain-containing protein n=1 Tax=Mycobacterium colombiense TaxID=339268 RepID=UPI00096C79E6|nr:CopG family transcriptional regulator [Mycobacterium colombiense]OMB91772.1 hypothetical protein A5732_20090 [Mycobacterium colombiense]OMC35327.1 hypothetical protein A5739_00485 [Mycobacterium colombiense]